MESREELEALKKEAETVNEKGRELTQEELDMVTGGTDGGETKSRIQIGTHGRIQYG